MERILELIRELIPNVEIEQHTDLITSHLLDSITTVELTALLEDEFDVEFTPLDITPDNFGTPAAILTLIEKKIGE